MKIFIALFVLLQISEQNQTPNAFASEEQSSDSLEKKLMNIRKVLVSRLDRCTMWRETIDAEDSEVLQRLLIKGQFQKFRDVAVKIARDQFPDDEDCLKSVQHLIRKHHRILHLKKRYLGSGNAGHIEEFLSPRQLNELHAIYKKTGRRHDIENALIRFFDGMSEKRIQQLIDEFFAYKPDLRRRPREVEDIVQEQSSIIVKPAELKEEWLTWMTDAHKARISRMKLNGSGQWEIMNRIADQFYHLRKDVRKEHEKNLVTYCLENLESVMGENNMNSLRNMFLDHDPVDQIETRFHVMVADLSNERDRRLADHYGSFCRKIFRLVHFQTTDMTSWLKQEQREQLRVIIQDPNIGDLGVYDKVFEFFEAAEGAQKEEARDTIDTGCRDFIAHMFGDDTAEEIEDMRIQGNVTTQGLAAKLAFHAKQVTSEKLRKRAEQSLPMCTRIYLAYNGSCDCNNHAKSCDPILHTCQNCTGNTQGVQCELCMDGFEGDPLSRECTEIEIDEESMEEEESAETQRKHSNCHCNHHSYECTKRGKCKNCLHNTRGDKCELCKPGYYGVATTGGTDDCTRCPCPDGGSCFVNSDGLVECNTCPAGWEGVTCEKRKENRKREEKERKNDKSEENFFFF